MSELTGNKIIGAALATALVLVGLGVVVPKFFEAPPPAKPGYLIAVAEEAGAGGATAPDVVADWGTALTGADVAAGEAKTAVCKSCHNFDPAGTNNIGPGLYGVVGRKPGTHPGFAYSPAMIAFGAKHPAWEYELIYEFIKGPQADISGTKMTFIGLKSPQDRINIIAYLHTLGSSLPIPKPNPKAAAGAPASAKPGTPTPAPVPSHPGAPA
ncbi:MAG: cytochrome c family protein [Caulobacteraceae bacterium]